MDTNFQVNFYSSQRCSAFYFTAAIRSKQNRAIDHQYNLDEETRNQSLRLLSFDGGGIRGLCLVILLIRIERHIRGGKIGDYFDWIAGKFYVRIYVGFLRPISAIFQINCCGKFSKFTQRAVG